MNHVGMKTLEAKRIILQLFYMKDAEGSFYMLLSDHEVLHCIRWQVHTDMD